MLYVLTAFEHVKNSPESCDNKYNVTAKERLAGIQAESAINMGSYSQFNCYETSTFTADRFHSSFPSFRLQFIMNDFWQSLWLQDFVQFAVLYSFNPNEEK